MPFEPNLIVLYVSDMQASINFYKKLLELAALELSPNFTVFHWRSGIQFALCTQNFVEPASSVTGGGVEFCLTVDGDQAVNAKYEQFKNQGVTILQQPTRAHFGYTFVAIDPDQHRLRICALSKS